jgi:hypothetical protein
LDAAPEPLKLAPVEFDHEPTNAIAFPDAHEPCPMSSVIIDVTVAIVT